MQRRIVIGVVVLALLLAGALLAYREIVRNQPASIWVPLPVNTELTAEKRLELCGEWEKVLREEGFLLKVVKDLGLVKELGVASEKEAVAEVSKRLFVRPGDAETEIGRVPAIHIGVTGKGREGAVMRQIAGRLMEEVSRVLQSAQQRPEGLDSPTF